MLEAPSLPRQAWRWRWRILAALLVLGLTAFALVLNIEKAQHPLPPAAVVGPRPVIAQAQVVPTQERQLAFQGSGRVRDVYVTVGQTVKAGDRLATLETADLQLKVAEAQANFDLQKATVAKSAEPPAAADIAAAKADLNSAITHQQAVERGAVAADLQSARDTVVADQAALASAQAQLKKLTVGPTASDLAGADASVRSAEAQLATAQQKLADTQAQPKPDDVNAAKLAVEQAKDTLWSTQISRDATCGQVGASNPLCTSANASVAAQETAVKTAQANLDKISQPATAQDLAAANSGVQSAQAAVASAQADLAKVRAGSTPEDRATAQAQVDQANANLRSAQAKLTQLEAGSTAADLAAAKSAVADAQAHLASLTAPPSQNTIDLGTAQVEAAQVQLQEAQQALKDAVIVAPFDGMVTSIALKPGDVAAPSTTALTVANLSSLVFETSDLDEIGAAKVHLGQPAQVTVAALNRQSFTGTVTEIDPQPSISSSGDVTYVVHIALKTLPPGLRWGQSARVEFPP